MNVETAIYDAAALRSRIATTDFSSCRATLIGYGTMGKQYFKALRALGVSQIRVCACHEASLAELQRLPGVELWDAGVETLDIRADGDELAILAVPIELLVPASLRLEGLGFRRMLIEKPIALESAPIATLGKEFEDRGVLAACAYNRAAYPALHEVRSRAAAEGGITSCTYTFTEMIHPDWPKRFSAVELGRWGIANSLHVMSMAHALIGWPKSWHGERTGAIAWHPAGAQFVGSGISIEGIPFAYHADWGSTGRWSVEAHTRQSSYRLCPLERVLRRTTALGEWEPVEVVAFAPDIKAGIVEELASMLGPARDLAGMLPTLRQTAELTAYGEKVFGYY